MNYTDCLLIPYLIAYLRSICTSDPVMEAVMDATHAISMKHVHNMTYVPAGGYITYVGLAKRTVNREWSIGNTYIYICIYIYIHTYIYIYIIFTYYNICIPYYLLLSLVTITYDYSCAGCGPGP